MEIFLPLMMKKSFLILMTIKTMFFPPKNNAETAENVLVSKNSQEKGEQ